MPLTSVLSQYHIIAIFFLGFETTQETGLGRRGGYFSICEVFFRKSEGILCVPFIKTVDYISD